MVRAKYGRAKRRGNPAFAAVMELTARMLVEEPAYCSRSYISQRGFESLGDYDLAIAIVNHMVASKALIRVDGSRPGFPDVYAKGPNWEREWVDAHWHHPVSFEYFVKRSEKTGSIQEFLSAQE